LHLAFGAGPDGTARRVRTGDAARRLGRCRVHRRVPVPRLRLPARHGVLGLIDRLDDAVHDPRVLADLADPVEAVVLEQLDGRAVQEAALRLAAGGHLGDGLDKPAAAVCDLVERALERRPRDALTPVVLVDVDAGDAPVRERRGVLFVLAPVLDAGEFFRAAVLAPALC